MSARVRIAVCVQAEPSPAEVADLALSGQLRLDAAGLDIELGHLAVGPQGFDEQALGIVAGLIRAGRAAGGPEVEGIALSVDPGSAGVFDRAFELGFSAAYRIDAGGTAADPDAVARLLAAAVRQIDADVVVLGDRSTTLANGIVGGLVAARLGRPCLAAAADLELGEGTVAVTQPRPGGGIDRLEAATPAVVTVRSDQWEPLRPKAADVLAARGKVATVLPAAELDTAAGEPEPAPAIERVGLRIDEAARTCEHLDGAPADVAGALLERLRTELAAERPPPPTAEALDPADAVVLPDTPEGRAAAAAIAVERGLPVVTGGTEIARTRAGLVVSRPIHGGAAVERVRVNTPAVLTLGTAGGAVAADPRIAVTPVVEADARPLDRARFVIGVGAGVGDDETFGRIRALSEQLGAVVGGSKVAVDRGWVGAGQKIGLTGTGIAADVYLAIGISGASQHMAGCTRAGTVVAVNCDRRAPIFRYARLGVVGDAGAIVDAMLAASRAAG